MKRFFLPLLFALVGCAALKPQTTVIVRDSIRVEYRERIVRDTAYFELPVEVEKNVTRDTASRLENSIAMSEAVVSGGFLYHNLQTKKQAIPVPIEVMVHDTTVIHVGNESTTQYITVEKPPNNWQRFRLNAFWWLSGTVLLLLLWIFRKPLLRLITFCS